MLWKSHGSQRCCPSARLGPRSMKQKTRWFFILLPDTRPVTPKTVLSSREKVLTVLWIFPFLKNFMFVLWFKIVKLSGKSYNWTVTASTTWTVCCWVLGFCLLSYAFGRLLFHSVLLYTLILEGLNVFYCCCDLRPLFYPSFCRNGDPRSEEFDPRK